MITRVYLKPECEILEMDLSENVLNSISNGYDIDMPGVVRLQEEGEDWL